MLSSKYKKLTKLTKITISALVLELLFTPSLYSKTFNLPEHGDIVGNILKVSPDKLQPEDNFLTISERYGVGFHELEEANPGYNPWSPSYGDLIIPQRYVLPKTRKGIVINLAELRLYYFPEGSGQVITYPIGIGKKDWGTPVVNTAVTSRVQNPTWTVPESIKQEYKERGEKIADSIPPGPNNPLGKYVLRLAAAGYLLHGSNEEVGVGLRVSHGCIRLFNPDIKNLYNIVPIGTPVRIINEPYKVGSDGKNIYLEAHKPLSEDSETFSYKPELIKSKLADLGIGYKIDWNATESAAGELLGIPVSIGNARYVNSLLED
ncbi:MAG: L,D-transpeptidase family protein [Gammaproteobacteria bacterium]|nr:L,D-transpeptidase family protein [Gammaproteobacteria bacterium]